MKNSPLRMRLDDQVVIYFSRADDRWIAHSLRTDQIGVGDCIVDALAEMIRVVDHLLAEAQADPTIAVLREAPAAVKKGAAKAKVLPGELFEIAHKKATGNWPAGLEVDVKPDQAGQWQSYTTAAREQAAC